MFVFDDLARKNENLVGAMLNILRLMHLYFDLSSKLRICFKCA